MNTETKYKPGDRVRAIEDYGWGGYDDNIASTGDLGTVVESEEAANPADGEFVTVKWDRSGSECGIFSFRIEKVETGSGTSTDPLAAAAVELARAKVERRKAYDAKLNAENVYQAAAKRERDAENALQRAVEQAAKEG